MEDAEWRNLEVERQPTSDITREVQEMRHSQVPRFNVAKWCVHALSQRVATMSPAPCRTVLHIARRNMAYLAIVS